MGQAGDASVGTAEAGSSSKPAAQTGAFVLNGEYWTIAYRGESFSLKNVLGLTYIQRLLQHPGEEFHALDLLSGASPATNSGTMESSPASISKGEDLIAGRPGDA